MTLINLNYALIKQDDINYVLIFFVYMYNIKFKKKKKKKKLW